MNDPYAFDLDSPQHDVIRPMSYMPTAHVKPKPKEVPAWQAKAAKFMKGGATSQRTGAAHTRGAVKQPSTQRSTQASQPPSGLDAQRSVVMGGVSDSSISMSSDADMPPLRATMPAAASAQQSAEASFSVEDSSMELSAQPTEEDASIAISAENSGSDRQFAAATANPAALQGTQAAPRQQAEQLRAGARVEARFGGMSGSEWYPGVIAAENPDGTFVVAYDDGDVEDAVFRRFLRATGGFGVVPASVRQLIASRNAAAQRVSQHSPTHGRVLHVDQLAESIAHEIPDSSDSESVLAAQPASRPVPTVPVRNIRRSPVPRTGEGDDSYSMSSFAETLPESGRAQSPRVARVAATASPRTKPVGPHGRDSSPRPPRQYGSPRQSYSAIDAYSADFEDTAEQTFINPAAGSAVSSAAAAHVPSSAPVAAPVAAPVPVPAPVPAPTSHPPSSAGPPAPAPAPVPPAHAGYPGQHTYWGTTPQPGAPPPAPQQGPAWQPQPPGWGPAAQAMFPPQAAAAWMPAGHGYMPPGWLPGSAAWHGMPGASPAFGGLGAVGTAAYLRAMADALDYSAARVPSSAAAAPATASGVENAAKHAHAAVMSPFAGYEAAVQRANRLFDSHLALLRAQVKRIQGMRSALAVSRGE